jgi:RHS repeat-associated protein
MPSCSSGGTLNGTTDKCEMQSYTWKESYFDGFGRTIKTVSEGPNSSTVVTEMVYDRRGAVYQQSLPYYSGDPSRLWTTFTYDPLGRVLTTTGPDNKTMQACYNDGVTVVIDQEGNRKRETKDAFGRLVQVDEYKDMKFTSCTTDPLTPYATTKYEYDVLGRLLSVTDHENNKTEMQYDTLGRKYYMKDPDMGEWRYTQYDANGNLKQQTDAKNQTITFIYDSLNRVTDKTYVNVTGMNVHYTYDDNTISTNSIGRLSRMTDASGTTTYAYDKLGRTTKIVKGVNGTGNFTAETTYDGLSRVRSIKYPDNEIVTYIYDSGGNLVTVSGGGTNYATYANFNALGQPGTVTNGNNVSTTYQYHSTNKRLINITTKNSAQVPLLNMTYDYFNNGNVKSIVDGVNSTRSQTFDYDELNRLKLVQSASYGTALSYDYSKIGNISSKEGITYYYSKVNAGPHAVTSTTDGRTYTYDKNGNMENDGVRLISYDYDNMPISMTKSGVTTTFMYDGNGARVKKIAKTLSGSIVETLYIGKLYEWSAGVGTKYIFAGGQRIAQKAGTNVAYYHQDHLGSTRLVSGPTGTIEEIYYYPFGAAKSDMGSDSLRHKYTSQEYDAETELYYYNARYYNPTLGRFISADTIVPDPANPQALNRYTYVLNNPMMYTDPSGHSFFKRLNNWAKKPWHAFTIQNFAPTSLLGTYYLTQSKTGRNILITEAAIAMFAAGTAGPREFVPYMVAGSTEGTYVMIPIQACGSSPWLCAAATVTATGGYYYDQQSEPPVPGGGTGGGGGGGGGTPGGGTPSGGGGGDSTASRSWWDPRNYVSISHSVSFGVEGKQMYGSAEQQTFTYFSVGRSLDVNIGFLPSPKDIVSEIGFGIGRNFLSAGYFFGRPNATGDMQVFGFAFHVGLGLGSPIYLQGTMPEGVWIRGQH